MESSKNSRNSRKTLVIREKLKEFEKNSSFSEKNQFFSEKTQENCQKTQGFANSTWFLMRKNVQK